jgi:hypothetical protein
MELCSQQKHTAGADLLFSTTEGPRQNRVLWKDVQRCDESWKLNAVENSDIVEYVSISLEPSMRL